MLPKNQIYTTEVACKPCNAVLSIHHMICPRCGGEVWSEKVIQVTVPRRFLKVFPWPSEVRYIIPKEES